MKAGILAGNVIALKTFNNAVTLFNQFQLNDITIHMVGAHQLNNLFAHIFSKKNRDWCMQ
jgi:hypothetical protein